MPTAIRGRVLSFGAEDHCYLRDGLIVTESGRIATVGGAATLLPRLPPGTRIDHFPDALILPGFIDTHAHYPQSRVIASYGTQLLDWLNRYTFPEEQRLRDPDVASQLAGFFIDEALRNGTTTAAVYCTVHPESVDAFFEQSERRNTRMIAGKVLMDRNCPEALRDSPETGARETEALVQRWHGRGRQSCAITPRFALTSTEAQLDAAGDLVRRHPDLHVQTHLSENHAEIETARSLFPWADSYTGIYDRYGLLGPNTLLGHCIHLDPAETELIAARRSVAVFCPTSNLFLGSGLFDRARLAAAGVRVALATDVGGGTSYSMLRTAAEAYKVLQLRGQSWPALAAFRQITRGNAEALGLDDRIGSIEPGYEADLVVLDARATPAMAHRMEAVAGDLAEELFVLMTLGDDRAVAATYVAGEKVTPLPR